ncbi:hypothetical protein SCOR_28300 [Sulfidibacter corallicola]|uniref:Uncharacterized protein n=1 Tax=Sulfidibacter corallicola TaxID=2818388 RepID=A0A8A4TNR8_SULCO|nr:hypothetical protein [Sulfidibacter corallicola]QTD50541.1 hypothetical protein J3U87_33575 [Sulfidibacter corallicola]
MTERPNFDTDGDTRVDDSIRDSKDSPTGRAASARTEPTNTGNPKPNGTLTGNFVPTEHAEKQSETEAGHHGDKSEDPNTGGTKQPGTLSSGSFTD